MRRVELPFPSEEGKLGELTRLLPDVKLVIGRNLTLQALDLWTQTCSGPSQVIYLDLLIKEPGGQPPRIRVQTFGTNRQ